MIDIIADVQENIIIRNTQHTTENVDEFKAFPVTRRIEVKIFPGRYVLPGNIERSLLNE